MDAEYFRTLYDYCYWARDRLLAAADGMTEEEYARPNGFTYDGLRSILTHALDAEAVWGARFRGATPAPIAVDELPTLAALRERWQEEESRMRDFLNGLSDADLKSDVEIRRRSGEVLRTPLWQLLAHVANHGTQHRSEAAEALTLVGRSPGSLDLTTFLWQQLRASGINA